MSLERCVECERIVDTDMEEGTYVETEFYCDSCAEKLELNDDGV